MSEQSPRYDVAISFLFDAEPLASEIHSKLTPQLNVFVSSQEQQEIAGTDGLDSFREVFRHRSLLTVVLFQDGWGSTRFTAIEERAIKDRCFEGEWDSLLFVVLDCDDTRPVWLPESVLWLDYSEYGLESLLGAIKSQVQRLGGRVRAETLPEQAARLVRENSQRVESARLIREEGFEAAKEQRNLLFECIAVSVSAIQEQSPELELRVGFRGNRDCVATTSSASILVIFQRSLQSSRSLLTVREYIGRMILPEEEGRLRSTVHPENHNDRNFRIDHQNDIGWCWSESEAEGPPITTQRLCETSLASLLNLHGKVARGELCLPSEFD